MDKYYKPSGSLSPLSFVYFLLACLVVIPILATIYAYAIWYIPFPYINMFIAGGFGFLAGVTIAYLVVRLGKVRNGKIAFLFGLLGGLVALYFHWAVWVDLVFNISDVTGGETIAVSNAKFGQVLSLATNPSGLFGIIGNISEFGTWGISAGAVKGTVLKVFWAIEALIIVGICSMLPPGQSGKPFCELNSKWFDEKNLKSVSFIENPAEVVKALESGDDTVFDSLELVADNKTDSHSVFTLYANETNENYLSISNNKAGLNDKNEVKFDERIIVNNISISEALSNKLEQFA